MSGFLRKNPVALGGAWKAFIPPAISLRVTYCVPNNGKLAYGTPLQIYGTNFVDDVGLSITIDGVLADDIVFVNDGYLTCTAPAGTAGAKNVLVTNPDGNTSGRTGNGKYTYNPFPVINSCTPSSGKLASGAAVRLNGTGFINGASITVDGYSVISSTFVNSTAIDCIMPGNTVGLKTVEIINPDTQSDSEDVYTYNPFPTVISCSPDNGKLAAGTAVTITGTGFIDYEGLAVTFNENPATNVVFVSDTEITCDTPEGLVGPATVRVTNFDTQYAEDDLFTYNPFPTVTETIPDHGILAGGQLIAVIGTGFIDGVGLSVTIGGELADGITYISDTQIDCTTPAGTAGLKTVRVTNPDTQYAEDDLFTYDAAPVVLSCSPDNGKLAAGTAVTITGTGFIIDAVVTFDGYVAGNINVISPTTITCETPDGYAGLADILVVNTDLQDSGTSGNGKFTYNPFPTFTSVDPTTGWEVGGRPITITGTGFITGATVTIGVESADNVIVVSSTEITCNSPVGSGVQDITITNPDTQDVTEAAAFTYYPAPTVSSITPDNGPESGGTAITDLAGTGFINGATVTIGGISADDVVVVSPTQITCTTPMVETTGAADVVVTNPDEQTSGVTGAGLFLFYIAPVISTVLPTNGKLAAGTPLTITGENFDVAATVTIDGYSATSVVVVSDTEITCEAPAGSAGTKDIVVINPGPVDSGISGNNLYTYNPFPTVTGVVPDNGYSIGGTAITDLQGTGFITGATVTIGGISADNIVVVSGIKITCTAPTGTAGAARDIVVTNPDTQYGTGVGLFTFYDAPTVTSITPNSGFAMGGTAITDLAGTGFREGATVTIGGASAGDIVVVSPTQITCTAPSGTAGAARDVVVTNSDSQYGTGVGLFTFIAAPTIASCTPDNGKLAAGTSVTITGTNFINDVGLAVTFDGYAATSVTWVSATEITCDTPDGYAGIATVRVTNPDTQYAEDDLFTYNAMPTVASCTPDNGKLAAGTSVSIAGTGFINGATVTFDGYSATSVTWISATEITCDTPEGAAGLATVRVTNPDTQYAEDALFTYNAMPTVASCTPDNGKLAAGTSVSIAGTGFIDGATVTFDGYSATSVTWVSATEITCDTPTGTAGLATVRVTNPDTQYTEDDLFTYNPMPTVASCTPDNGKLAAGIAVSIIGTGFINGAAVTFDGYAATSVTWVSATEITCDTPDGYAGIATVRVTNPDTQYAEDDLFTYNPMPTVSSCTPDNGKLAAGTPVSIAGTGFITGATVTFDGYAATSVIWVSATEITCDTPEGTAGLATVRVTNPDTQYAEDDLFTYNAMPTVTSCTPDNGKLAAGTSVSIAGTGFINGATVTFDGYAATSVTWVSATEITCDTPEGAAGLVAVRVTNPDTQYAEDNLFTYNPFPTVTSITPSSGYAVGGTAITDLAGTGFLTGATVTIGGGSAGDVVIVSGIKITCTAPSGTSGAARDVVVTNLDTQSGTGVGLFTFVDAPTVTNCTPNHGIQAGGTSVSIAGTNFVNDVGLAVTFDGYSATSVTWVSATEITCDTPANADGYANILVTNPDAQNSASSGNNAYYYDAAPTVSSCTPNNGKLAGGTSVSIAGTNFVNDVGLAVTFDGYSATSVTWVSATEITCNTPANSSGTADIVVTNPDSQNSGTSGNSKYTYNPFPTFTSITPATGDAAGGTAITDLAGTGFITGATVTFDGYSATSVTVVSAIKITCTTPANADGYATVRVTNPDTQYVDAVDAFNYTSASGPVVDYCSPNEGTTIAITSGVNIYGTGFVNPITSITFGGTAATSLTFISATHIRCAAPVHAAGAVTVVVTCGGSDSGTTGAGAFTYVAPSHTNPVYSSATPSYQEPYPGDAAGFTINGSNFDPGCTVEFSNGDVNLSSLVRISSTQLYVDCVNEFEGTTEVRVKNPDGAYYSSWSSTIVQWLYA